MNPFHYKNNQLYCEEVSVEKIAQKYGTPLYVYSYTSLKDQIHQYQKAFSDVDHLICYSMKANSNRAVLRAFIKEGAGIDVVTGGELSRALAAGCDRNKIVFSGVGKSDEEIRDEIAAGILQFNVESEPELEAMNRIAASLNKKAPIALRVNPDVDPKTHPYIATGFKKSKFGIPHGKVIELYKKAAQMSHIKVVGIDCHIGSQLTLVDPFVEALKKIKDLVLKIRQHGIEIQNIDIGGGLGIVYDDETPPSIEDYAKAIKKELHGLNLKIILEPGRSLVGQSGILVTKVLYNKEGEVKHFVIVDAAANDLWRPSLYGAYHRIIPVLKDEKALSLKVNVVGPICESGDYFALDRELPSVQSGEFLAIMSAGAYGFSMASTYNSRPRCAEVMIHKNEDAVIREREKVEDLTRGEKVPEFLE